MSVATAIVYTCPSITNAAILLGGVPQCADGSWQVLEVAAPVNMDDFDPAAAGSAFGAGFLILGTGLILAFAIRLIVRFVRDA